MPGAIFACIFSLSLFAFLQLRAQERNSRNTYLSTQCIRKKNSTRNEVRGGTTVLQALHTVADIFQNENWAPFADRLLKDTPWRMVGVALLTEMSGTDLAALALRRHFRPTQLNPENGNQVPLIYDRDRYLVIVEDIPDVQRIGYDYYSDPHRKKLVYDARARGNLTLSNPTIAIGGSEITVVFFIPIYDRSGKFIGGVSAGYRGRNLLPLAVMDDVLLSLSIDGAMVYEDDGYNDTSMRAQETLVLADKMITVKCGVNMHYAASSTIVLCIGLVSSISLAVLSLYVMHLIRARQNSMITRLKVEEDKRLANVERSVAQEASKAKSAFVANISHELRTPLQGLLWMTNFLLGTNLTAEQKDYAITLQTSGESLLQIVNDVLDFSKIEAGKLNLEMIPVRIKDVLNQLLLFYKAQSVLKSNSFTIQDTLDDNKRIITDPTRLRQILNNLVGNAMKFTHEGSIILKCTRQNEWIRFECIDEGIGMTPVQQSQLFQAYVQGDASTTRRYGGTGLGLSICKQLVEALHGTIGCTSTFGKGSTFYFTIPYIPTDDPAPNVKLETVINFKGTVVIVADDNVINRKVAGKLLTELGIRVEMAENGQQVLDLLADADKHYNCILMDGFMPELDGYETTKIIRQNGNTIPIIAVTANAMAGEKERCLSLGMNAFVAKPIVREELLLALSQVM